MAAPAATALVGFRVKDLEVRVEASGILLFMVQGAGFKAWGERDRHNCVYACVRERERERVRERERERERESE